MVLLGATVSAWNRYEQHTHTHEHTHRETDTDTIIYYIRIYTGTHTQIHVLKLSCKHHI